MVFVKKIFILHNNAPNLTIHIVSYYGWSQTHTHTHTHNRSPWVRMSQDVVIVPMVAICPTPMVGQGVWESCPGFLYSNREVFIGTRKILPIFYSVHFCMATSKSYLFMVGPSTFRVMNIFKCLQIQFIAFIARTLYQWDSSCHMRTIDTLHMKIYTI